MKFKLINEVMQRSLAKNWDDAIKEWKIYGEYEDKDFDVCLCEHYPIKQVILLSNYQTKNKIKVGNCCINKFFGDKSYNKFFKALKEKRINRIILDIAFERNYINEKSYNFACDIWRKKYLSPKQEKWFDNIKKIIFKNFKKREDDSKTIKET